MNNPNINPKQFDRGNPELQEHYDSLAPMKQTLKKHGYSYSEVIGWARNHPKFAQSTKRELASHVAQFHDQDPETFMTMLHHELP
jgi:hypothetical protein